MSTGIDLIAVIKKGRYSHLETHEVEDAIAEAEARTKRINELEQQLAKYKKSMVQRNDQLAATEDDLDKAEAKLTEQDKLLDKCLEQVQFAIDMPRSAEAQRRLILLRAQLQERDRDG